MQFLDTADFQKIEDILSIQLPAHFKKFHLERRDLIQKLNQVEEDYYIFVNADTFIDTNTMYAIPKNKASFGKDGGGLPYLMDVTPHSTDETVYSIPDRDYPEEELAELYDPDTHNYNWHDPRCQSSKNLVEFAEDQIKFWKSIGKLQ